MPQLPPYGLYVLTDCDSLDSSQLLEKTEVMLEAGIALLQYRNKRDGVDTRHEQAAVLQSLCKHYGVPLIINDDAALAREINADGVHLGGDDMPCSDARSLLGEGHIIGISCYNSLPCARSAVQDGADYVAFGSFYPSDTKPGAVSAGTELLRAARREISLPIVAIGGITPGNAAPLLEAGARFLAVSRALYRATDPGAETKKFNRLFTNKKSSHE